MHYVVKETMPVIDLGHVDSMHITLTAEPEPVVSNEPYMSFHAPHQTEYIGYMKCVETPFNMFSNFWNKKVIGSAGEYDFEMTGFHIVSMTNNIDWNYTYVDFRAKTFTWYKR